MNDRRTIRGWKSIGGYLGVAPSTAIRWAKDQGLPVVQAAKGSTVYAFPGELDGWQLRRREVEPAESRAWADVPPSAATPLHPPAVRRPLWATLIAVLVLLGSFGTWLVVRGTPEAAPAPERNVASADPRWQDQYLAARALWATQRLPAVQGAIGRYQAILRAYPDAGKALVGLADAYLTACTLGGIDPARAMARASSADARALGLAPDDADARRIAGFLAYWMRHDLVAARSEFDTAARLAPDNFLVQLWYGEVLLDAGQVQGALPRLAAAVSLGPDSETARMAYADGLMRAGRTAEAQALVPDGARHVVPAKCCRVLSPSYPTDRKACQ